MVDARQPDVADDGADGQDGDRQIGSSDGDLADVRAVRQPPE
jgi:hypothetical protein